MLITFLRVDAVYVLLEGEAVYVGAGNVCVHPQSDSKLLENDIVLRCMSHVNYFFPLVAVLS